MNMSIRENIQQVRENIAAAALSAGRRPEDITLVGASKTVSYTHLTLPTILRV